MRIAMTLALAMLFLLDYDEISMPHCWPQKAVRPSHLLARVMAGVQDYSLQTY